MITLSVIENEGDKCDSCQEEGTLFWKLVIGNVKDYQKRPLLGFLLCVKCRRGLTTLTASVHGMKLVYGKKISLSKTYNPKEH